MSKADNMLAILWLLKSRRRMTAKQLSDELEIHIRTVYRCIDALCISGVPIVAEVGRDGGYTIPDSLKLEPLFFDGEEQKALLQAAAFARESGYPSEEALNRAIAKMKRYTNPQQLESMERRETHIEVIQPPVASALSSMLAELEAGIDGQTSLDLTYMSGYDSDATKRRIDPYGLVHWRAKWYVVGYCHLREALRSFRVDRIDRIANTPERFDRPAAFSARQYLLGSLLSEPGESDGSDNSMISVLIQGSPQAINELCGHWLLGHALVERTSSEARFRVDEWSLYTQIAYYLLSFGGKLRVVEPEELKGHMIDIAEDLLDYYRS
ncbi:WYL domain-containing protein [Paenibacillus sp. 1011MAR3C5]|uniref:helix-turn-helix transcriptional regulator n=1 Tax=Paenibacillus sp. 1011MAR3C5 TaxID=1675787 RepID=UPI000E6B854E|nr:WYL domain-containing protein [Paenibacillus sp. 1011MAR3C5]RJE89625.1 WYL domain-containing protein [Paenibacillus sp. 1011MAR3C5]